MAILKVEQPPKDMAYTKSGGARHAHLAGQITARAACLISSLIYKAKDVAGFHMVADALLGQRDPPRRAIEE